MCNGINGLGTSFAFVYRNDVTIYPRMADLLSLAALVAIHYAFWRSVWRALHSEHIGYLSTQRAIERTNKGK